MRIDGLVNRIRGDTIMNAGSLPKVFVLSLALALPMAIARADDASPKQLQTIRLPGNAGNRLDHLALDSKREHLLVANTGNKSLDVVNLRTGKVVKSIPDQEGIQGLLYIPGADHLVATLGKNTCNVFDAASFKQAGKLKVPDADSIAFDARNNLVCVASGDRKIALFDARTMAPKGEIKLPTFPESLVIEKSRPRMYVNAPVPHQVLVVDTARREVLKRYPLPEAGNYPLALDEANHHLFVGCRKEPCVIVLDTETGKQVARVTIPGDVDDLYFDAARRRLYASCGEGYLAVIRQASPTRYDLLAKVPTAKQARTCLFDPASSRIYLAVPRGKDGPEIRVFDIR